jgi:paraquat-inducible protein A
MSHTSFIACQDCDLLQRKTALLTGETAYCRRCGDVLYRSIPGGFDRTLACMLGAAVLFAVANAFPIVALEAQGARTSTTLFGAVRVLHDQHMTSVAALIFTTTTLMPALEISAMLYMLLPLKLGRVPKDLPAMFRLVQTVRPWGMVEVFMLGILVSLAKLTHIAHVVPGIALWSFGVLMLLLAAAAASFEAQDLWARVEAITHGKRQKRVQA